MYSQAIVSTIRSCELCRKPKGGLKIEAKELTGTITPCVIIWKGSRLRVQPTYEPSVLSAPKLVGSPK